MSEKRISILEVEDHCKGCGGIVCDKCADRDFFFTLPTREQAIEAMVNGMIEKDENSPDGAGFIDLAEAALNALLEDNNASKN